MREIFRYPVRCSFERQPDQPPTLYSIKHLSELEKERKKKGELLGMAFLVLFKCFFSTFYSKITGFRVFIRNVIKYLIFCGAQKEYCERCQTKKWKPLFALSLSQLDNHRKIFNLDRRGLGWLGGPPHQPTIGPHHTIYMWMWWSFLFFSPPFTYM